MVRIAILFSLWVYVACQVTTMMTTSETAVMLSTVPGQDGALCVMRRPDDGIGRLIWDRIQAPLKLSRHSIRNKTHRLNALPTPVGRMSAEIATTRLQSMDYY